MRMSMATKWRKLLPWLRGNFPTQYPVKVRCVTIRDMEKYNGDCNLVDDGEFRIRINHKRSFALRLDTILHEWAHALTWFADSAEDHSAEWGVAYAKVYRALWAWNFGCPVDPDEE